MVIPKYLVSKRTMSLQELLRVMISKLVFFPRFLELEPSFFVGEMLRRSV